jgi:DNA-binding IclR family transcriptional regulator
VSASRGRTALIADGLRALLWVADTHRPFTWRDLAEGCEFQRRTAYRWLEALAAVGAIESATPEVRQVRGKRRFYRIGRFGRTIARLRRVAA